MYQDRLPIPQTTGAGAGAAAPVQGDDSDEINIGQLIGTLLAYKWLILCVTALAVAIGSIVAFAATPIYRADALLQVDEKGKAGLSVLKDLEPLMGEATSVAAQLEILNSRMVLGRTVEKLGLDVVAEPLRAPLLGGFFARRYQGEGPAAPMLGLASYAWGGERIAVSALTLPAMWQDQVLLLQAGEADTYRLMDPDGVELLAGKVGVPAMGSGIALTVTELLARPASRFSVARLSTEEAINRLRNQFVARERGRKSGIIEASLTGPQRDRLPLVLNEIIGIYYRQNLERRATEAENQLQFLETQLPTLKAQLDTSEAAYNSYRQSRGSVDLDLETQGVLRSLIEVDTEVAKLRQEREEMRQLFTPNHPRMMALDAKLKILNERKSGFDRGVNRLPDTQQTALRLKRDVEVSTTLYIGLLSTAQQLRVSKAGTVGEVRIIDQATVARLPVEPKKRVVVGLAAVVGLLAGLVLVWALRVLRVVVEEPESIEKRLGLPVLASVPHSKAEGAMALRLKKGRQIGGSLLALSQPDDDAVESLRSLRATLHFAMLNAQRQSVLITGPSQDIGKSFVSKNLAAVLAQAGKRVVLVDADLRKGHIHKEFALQRDGGVSEFVNGQAELATIIHSTGQPGLSVVTTGCLVTNPSETLMHPRFEELLENLQGLFDIVVIDAPPVLAVSDAAIVGRFAGITLVVARAGRHPIRELAQTVKRLEQAGVRVSGVVFNDFDVNRQRYRYGYDGYVYRYTYSKDGASA